MCHLPAGNEIRVLEVFKRDGNFGLMQPARVPGHETSLQFSHSKAGDVSVGQLFQADKAIRTYGYGLVELGREADVDVNGVALAQPIQRTAVPHLVMVWT